MGLGSSPAGAGLLLAAALLGGGAAPEPMRETLASIDAILAREAAGVHNARQEMLWIDGDRLLMRADEQRFEIMLVDARAPARRVALADDSWLRPALAAARVEGDVRLDGLSGDGKTLFLVNGGRAIAVDLQAQRVAIDPVRTASLAVDRPQLISDQFPTTFGPLVEAASPDGKRFVGRRDNNVYVRDAGSVAVRFVTSDGAPKHAWLDTEESAQGLNALWSPDGRRIAAVRLDSRGVAHEPVIDWLTTPPTVEWIAYPRAGEPIHRFELAVIDAQTGAKVIVRTGDTADHYVNLLGWLADGTALLYQVVDREQKVLRIYRADATSGDTRLLLTETRPTYIDTPMTLSPALVHPLPGGGFLYLSERSGWRHIERYDGDGRRVAQLTRGDWAVEDIVRIDAARVYFRAARDAAYAAALYRIPLAGGPIEQLTHGGNVRDIAFSAGGRFFTAVRSSPALPPIAELHSADGRETAVLATAAIDPGLPVVEQFATPSGDARFAMHGLIVRPAGFDPARRYPVVEVIYGGMQLDFLPRDAYATGWWRSGYNALMGRLLANRGAVVVYMNAPGTPGRGRAFQDATYGIWPQTVIANHARFIRDAAATRPWMDLGRVGIFGSSWGGYLAQRALIDAPDLYTAAVSMSPPSDFADHPTYIEPFMGLPSHNPAGYAAGSNLTRLDRIRGSVLVMPQPFDVNAGFSPAMKFVDGMIAAGGDVTLFTMPGVNHRVNCCGWRRERHAYAVSLRFLGNKLQPDSEP